MCVCVKAEINKWVMQIISKVVQQVLQKLSKGGESAGGGLVKMMNANFGFLIGTLLGGGATLTVGLKRAMKTALHVGREGPGAWVMQKVTEETEWVGG